MPSALSFKKKERSILTEEIDTENLNSYLPQLKTCMPSFPWAQYEIRGVVALTTYKCTPIAHTKPLIISIRGYK